MVMKKLLTKFVDTLRVNTEVKNHLLDLELKIEAQRKDFEEIKSIVLNLSVMVNSIQTQLNHILDKQNKGL